MSLSKINNLKDFDLKMIENEIMNLKKNLFYLRIKKATGQKIKPHFFKHYYHKLNQLILLKKQKIVKN
jgi:large subunit ribosomal protein L29